MKGDHSIKFVWGPCLALADALNFRSMQGVQLILVLSLLRQDPMNTDQKIIRSRSMRFRNDIDVPLNIAVDTPHSGLQCS